jgi:hypothetical protein
MSGDCCSTAIMTAHVSASKPTCELVNPMSRTVPRTSFWKSSCALVVISPATSTNPVLATVSHATRLYGSAARHASRMVSETASQSLSG